jgi:hypothetical protein
MTPDPKWLELLKAGGWQKLALAAAFGIFWIFISNEIVPKPSDPLWIYIPALGFVTFSLLSLAAIATVIWDSADPLRCFRVWLSKRREQKEVEHFIPYMTATDKKIIGYLLHHQQKMFSAADDGGYAAPLISRRIIRLAGIAGQTVRLTSVPFQIPDHIWIVLERNRHHFPPPPNSKGPPPWVVPFMAL